MTRKTPLSLAAAAVALLLLLPASGHAASQQRCFDVEVTNAFWEVSSSVQRIDRSVTHTGQPKDADSNSAIPFSSSTTYIWNGTDHDLKIDDSSKALLTDTEWYRNGACATVSATVFSGSVTFPAIYGVCGPRASLDVGLTLAGYWKSTSSGGSRVMPALKVKPRAAASLSCGVTCFDVWGGLWATAEFGVKPWSGAPGDALERYLLLNAGPEAGASIACFQVWGWSENLYSNKVISDIYWI